MRSMLSNRVLRLTAAATLLALGGCVAYPAGGSYYSGGPGPVGYGGGYYAPAPVVVDAPVVVPFGGFFGGYGGGYRGGDGWRGGGDRNYWHGGRH